jgi:hypothetical protein
MFLFNIYKQNKLWAHQEEVDVVEALEFRQRWASGVLDSLHSSVEHEAGLGFGLALTHPERRVLLYFENLKK